MKRLSLKAVLLLGILPCAACTLFAPTERIRIERLSNHYYPARVNTGEVQLFFEDIKLPYESIARISGQGKADSTITGLLVELQQKAAEIGADALVNVKTGQRLVTGTGYPQGLQQDYGLPANRDNPVGQMTNGQQIPWATAIAVRFIKEEKGAPK